MADSQTARLGLIKPEPGGSNGTWGEKLNNDIDEIDLILGGYHYAEDWDNHSGLNFAFKSGLVRDGAIIQSTVAGNVTLTDGSTNYVEVDPADGVVKTNTVGFTPGRVPLFVVVTDLGTISSVTDKRAFLVKAVPVNKQWFFSFAGEGTESTTSNLTKGSVFEPVTDIKCYGIGLLNSDANTQNLKLRIYELNGTTQVGESLIESENIGAAGEQTFISYDFLNPVLLLSGHRYVVAVSNVTAGATLVKADYIAHPSNQLTGFKRNTFATINNANPENGAVWTVGSSSSYGCGIKILIE